MGRHEPQRHRAKIVKRISGSKIVAGLASILTSVTAAGYLAISPSFTDISNYAPTSHKSRIASSSIDVVGTTPLADADYLQVLPHTQMTTEELMRKLSTHGLHAYAEPMRENVDRILVKYRPNELHQQVKELQKLGFGARLMKREHGKESIRDYVAPSRINYTLDDYLKAANGHMELMPFYESVHREAQAMAATLPYSEKECEKLIYTIKWQESSFRPHLTSKAGARGLMQVMPPTAKWLGFTNTSKLYEPDYNIQAGGRALTLSIQYATRKLGLHPVLDVLPLAGAHYNAGEGNVESKKYLLFKETRKYMHDIRQHYAKLNTAFPG
jgi:hypothetical protein